MDKKQESVDTENEGDTDSDGRTGERIEEAEDELSRHETKDSAPEPNLVDLERVTNRPTE